tara:strand:- start:12 stop:227 length:216 start_codon:yes stop_codon:yes gene_type:complete
MDVRICPNCGESCEKEIETIIIHGEEYCVCCNFNIESNFNDDALNYNYPNDTGEKNNAFIDFFNESGSIRN